MKYSIEHTETGWNLVGADGKVVATFAGEEEQAYHDAIAHLGALISRARAEQLAAVDEVPVDGATTTDDGLLPETWTSDGMGIAFCESLPGGRDFTDCDWTWRDPASGLVPLMLQTANEGGHWGAELAGFVEAFTGGGNAQVDASGRFYDNDAGQQFRTLLLDGRRFGVSVDPSEAVTVEFECTDWNDEYGWCEAGLDKFTAYEIAGLTGVPFPGFEDAAIKLAASRRIMFLRPDGAIRLAGADSIVPMIVHVDSVDDVKPVRAALSVPLAPSRAWFETPEPDLGVPFLDGLLGDDVLVEQGDGALACPAHYGSDGRVYGHLTHLGQCHVGNPWGAGRCASAPRSANSYADFHGAGHVVCDDGTDLPTGLLHVGCEHSTAMDVRGVRDAAAHAGLAFAQVRVVDGQYGPWMSGCLLPTVTEEQLVKLRALTLSGEWAPELGAVIAVNDGGLPLARKVRIAASNGSELVVADRTMRASMKDGKLAKLVGGPTVRACPECAKRRAARGSGPSNADMMLRLDTMLDLVDKIERRTRHQVAAEAEAERSRLAASSHA